MPGQFTPPNLTGTVKKLTENYSFVVPRFDAPGWGVALEENWDTLDSVLYAFSGITNVKGNWDNSTSYVVADRVVDVTNNTLWQAYVAHTSAASGTFAQDRAAHPTYWKQVTGGSVPRGQWTTVTNYNTGEIVTDAGRTGVINDRYVSGASYNADVTAGHITTIVDTSGFIDFTTAINAAPNKPTLIDADLFGIVDKAGVAVTKNHTWAQLKTMVKGYADTLYQPLSAILSATTASFTTAKDNKLTGIEALADVTDAANVGSSLGGLTPTGSISDTDEIAGNTGNTLKTWTWATLKASISSFIVDIIVQPGTIVATGRSTPDPGYLECNGAAVSRTGANAALFAAIGTAYGVGNGSSTFNVPDFRGEFLRGWDHGRGVDSGRGLGGAVQGDTFESHAHTLTMNAVAPHAHTYGPIPGTYGLNGQTYSGDQFHAGSGDSTRGSYTITTTAAGGHTPTGSIAAVGGTETRPRNVTVMYQIKL